MRLFRALAALVSALALSGCGYIHFGRLPASATVVGDAKLAEAYSQLSTEHKILKQELVLVRREGDALRTAVERAGASANSTELARNLRETGAELATLRAAYAKLQAERSGSDPASREKLGELENKLAASLRDYTALQAENNRLRGDLDRSRSENTELAGRLQTVSAQNEQTQQAYAQLNRDFLALKDARAKAEQAAEGLRAQLAAVASSAPSPAAGSGGTRNAAPVPAALTLAKAPPADPTPTAELRTQVDRLKEAQAATSSSPAAKGPRRHVVRTGDTLEKIARQYYGVSERWSTVYDANAALLANGKPLQAGMELVIPEL